MNGLVGVMSNGASGQIDNNYRFSNSPPPHRFQPKERMRIVANAVPAEVYRVCQTTPHRD